MAQFNYLLDYAAFFEIVLTANDNELLSDFNDPDNEFRKSLIKDLINRGVSGSIPFRLQLALIEFYSIKSPSEMFIIIRRASNRSNKTERIAFFKYFKDFFYLGGVFTLDISGKEEFQLDILQEVVQIKALSTDTSSPWKMIIYGNIVSS